MASVEAVRIRGTEVDIAHLPALADSGKRSRTIRFSPFTGSIYIPSEVGLEYQEFGDLGTAIQQIEFELGERAVVERERVEGLINCQRRILSSLMFEGRLTRERGEKLKHLLPEIRGSLLAYRQELSDLRNIYGTNKRVGSLTAEIKFNSVFWQELKVYIREEIIRENRPFLGVLILEEEFSQQRLRKTVDSLGKFNDVIAVKKTVHSERRVSFSRDEEESMKKFLQVTAASLIEVGLNPYLQPAREASINLVGSPEERSRVDRDILEEKSDVIDLVPIIDLIRDSNFTGAELRIENRSRWPLEFVLEMNRFLNVA